MLVKFVMFRMGDNLRVLRESRDMSVSDLSFCSGLSVDAIRGYESGKSYLEMDVLLLLCVVLGVEPNDFFAGLYY